MRQPSPDHISAINRLVWPEQLRPHARSDSVGPDEDIVLGGNASGEVRRDAALAVFEKIEGVIQPLVLSVQARAAGRHQQGAVVGLRQTGQRFTSIVVPPIMGVIADRSGVSESFLVLGGFMLLLCIPFAMIIRRVGSRQSLDESLAGATD